MTHVTLAARTAQRCAELAEATRALSWCGGWGMVHELTLRWGPVWIAHLQIADSAMSLQVYLECSAVRATGQHVFEEGESMEALFAKELANNPDDLHVLPEFPGEREHQTTMHCWCVPRRDQKNALLVVHDRRAEA